MDLRLDGNAEFFLRQNLDVEMAISIGLCLHK